jgi:uncharacterized protein YjbJ (UPF0337 family)
MNWDQVEGKWKQMKGAVREQWGKLTDDDLQAIGGRRDQLIGKIQERYGIIREEATKRVDEWVTSYQGEPAMHQRDTGQHETTHAGRTTGGHS